MKTIIRLLFFALLFGFTVFFNAELIDIRFDEIRYLLGTIAATDRVSNTFGIVAKYELIKRRMLYGDENVNNYEFEAKIQALTSGDQLDQQKSGLSQAAYQLPVRVVLNTIRVLLGKPIISLKAEDKIFSVLEIGYFWERNRRYNDALDIYDEVLETAHLAPEIRAAVLVHKSFCYSMVSNYDKSKLIYEQVINAYPNTEAGILSWKLLDFIQNMEKEREALQQKTMSTMEKAKQSYLLMDFRNSIKNYSVYLEQKKPPQENVEALFYKGRSHEELGESEEAIMSYRMVINSDKTKVWARQANRRMLMLGEFYDQQKSISNEAKRQLEIYQDQVFIKNVEKYSGMVSKSTLKSELIQEKKHHDAASAGTDSLLDIINQIGSLDLNGANDFKEKKTAQMRKELIDHGKLTKAEIVELERRQTLSDNPFRRPTVLKKYIDENSIELRYLYNKKLRTGVKLSGRMLVEIKIEANGSVEGARVLQSDMGDTDFEEDILQRVRAWKFRAVPDSLGQLTVNYPFEFSEEQ